MKKRLLALLMALAMVFALAACSDSGTQEPDNGDEQQEETTGGQDETPAEDGQQPEDEQPQDAGEKTTIRAGFLKGPTGIGAAYLMQQNENGEARLDYDVTMDTDAQNVNAAIISGELDIAAVPTNVASVLYNKTIDTENEIQIVAINTLGVLYILENGDTIQSVDDLVGKTIYTTGQGSNPQYVLEYILSEHGLTVGQDVFVEYMTGDEVATQMASGMIDVCMLPVPNVTSVLVQNSDVRIALSMEEEWESVTGGSSVLTQGCIVARADTVTDEILADFLADYEESINFMADEANLEEAAALAVKYEIVASEAIATAALPDCNLVYIADPDTMREYLQGYFEVLYQADPASVGGSVPDDAFYR